MPPSSHHKNSFFLTALVLLTQISTASAAEISEHMKAGQQLFQSKMYRAAISEFEQATKEQPNDATAHYYLAVSHVRAGNVSQAYPHFQQASGLSTNNSQIHQMASSALNAYRSEPTLVQNTATAAPANIGPLMPSKSYNGGASAELDKQSSFGSSSPLCNQPTQSTYTPARNFSPANFSQSPQALYPQNFNHIPGYQSNKAWGATNKNRSGMWGTGGGHSGYNAGGAGISSYSGGTVPVTPTLAIWNANSSVPITKDMTAADQSLTMIKRQSDTQVHNAANGVHMEYYGSSLNYQQDQIRRNAQAQIDKMLTPTYHGRRRGYYSTASQAQIDLVNYQAGAQIFNMRRETDRAENARQIQQATSEAAANLSDQIRDQRLTGSGVMLRAEGTNLNVRNYETFHSDKDDRDAILPMVAHPMTLKEAEKSLPVTPLTVPTKHYSIDQ
ncbi:MAG: tetratricopeptide repeat protein [Candidatus Obscuribacterales bacterium]|nr:tetratricopeptide repeat protein [Candidatus Obscuribacterales bacterium]